MPSDRGEGFFLTSRKRPGTKSLLNMEVCKTLEHVLQVWFAWKLLEECILQLAEYLAIQHSLMVRHDWKALCVPPFDVDTPVDRKGWQQF